MSSANCPCSSDLEVLTVLSLSNMSTTDHYTNFMDVTHCKWYDSIKLQLSMLNGNSRWNSQGLKHSKTHIKVRVGYLFSLDICTILHIISLPVTRWSSADKYGVLIIFTYLVFPCFQFFALASGTWKCPLHIVHLVQASKCWLSYLSQTSPSRIITPSFMDGTRCKDRL